MRPRIKFEKIQPIPEEIQRQIDGDNYLIGLLRVIYSQQGYSNPIHPADTYTPLTAEERAKPFDSCAWEDFK